VGDTIPVAMNKVWPFNNPHETYPYYDFPFCQPTEGVEQHWMTLGQVLRGDRLVNSLYSIRFRTDLEANTVCDRNMSAAEVQQLKDAVQQHYMFEFFVNDLPVVRPFGIVSPKSATVDKDRIFLLTYMEFEVGYNGDQVVSVNVTSEMGLEHLTDITDLGDQSFLPFKYSVKWKESSIPYHQALKTQVRNMVQNQHQSVNVHWLAIINSFVLMLLILSLLLLIIVRVVRSDLSRYLSIPDEELNSVEEDSGWKLLHADIFRSPVHRIFLCAAVGSGAQLFSMIMLIVIVGCIAQYYERGAVASAAVVCYMLTAFIGGFVSAAMYQTLGGEKWAWNIFLTALSFTGPVFGVWCINNTIAWGYGSTSAFPFGYIVLLFGLWACITFPLTVLGGIVGRRRSQKRAETTGRMFPCKTNRLARQVPSCHWYQAPATQLLAVGFLPFSSIYIELHYIFNSIWGSKIYTLYGMLLLAFLMLLCVAATVTVLFTYFHLNAEDYRWWWRSFLSGSALSIFFYAYCIYFYFQTGMYGLLQSSFFFLYSAVVAYGLALVMGCVSFGATFWFILYIYSSIKVE